MRLKLSEKDYQWIIVVLVLIVVFILTLYYGGRQSDIVSYISFAGTIASIILSVLAIIYTYFQTGISTTTADNLVKASGQLDSALNQLRSGQEQVAVTLQSLEMIGQQVTRVESTVTTMATKLGDAQDLPDDEPAAVPADLHASLRVSSPLGLVLLHLLGRQVLKPKELSLETIIGQVNESGWPDRHAALDFQYAWGFLMGFACTGNLNFLEISPILKPDIPNVEDFNRLVTETIQARLLTLTAPQANLTREAYDAVEAIYRDN